jgi:hypothetical protein
MHFTDWGGPLHTLALHAGVIFHQLSTWLHTLETGALPMAPQHTFETGALPMETAALPK